MLVVFKVTALVKVRYSHISTPLPEDVAILINADDSIGINRIFVSEVIVQIKRTEISEEK